MVSLFLAEIILSVLCHLFQIDYVAKETAASEAQMKAWDEATAFVMHTDDIGKETKPTVDFMTSELPVAEAIDGMYPCMLAMLGSAFGFMTVNKNIIFSIHYHEL